MSHSSSIPAFILLLRSCNDNLPSLFLSLSVFLSLSLSLSRSLSLSFVELSSAQWFVRSCCVVHRLPQAKWFKVR